MWRWLPWLLTVGALACAGGELQPPTEDAGRSIAARTDTAPLPTETERPPSDTRVRALAGGAQLVRDGQRLSLDIDGERWTLADAVVGEAAVDEAGERLAFARRGDADGLSSIEGWWREADGTWSGPRVLASPGDRPALSADGGRLAFVSGRSGIASLWVVPFDGGEPLQLTNVGVVSPALGRAVGAHAPEQPTAPAGFVPPPHRGQPRFDGERLVWTAPDGEHAVELP